MSAAVGINVVAAGVNGVLWLTLGWPASLACAIFSCVVALLLAIGDLR